MPDASPAKWHRAHTTWFFEQFLLGQHCPGYQPFHPDYAFLVNSYYVNAGPRHARHRRGDLTRPAAEEITALLEEAGVRMLEGTAARFDLPDGSLGVAGVKGFGGGFAGKCASRFGEREMKAFVETTMASASSLREALRGLDTDIVVALTHYSPIPGTLHGEPPEIHPFLGSYLLCEPIDEASVDLALHGHAHFGCEQGVTPGGVRVRNVAQPVIRKAYAL